MLAINIHSGVVQGKRNRLNDVVWVLVKEIKKLLDVGIPALVQLTVVYVDYNLLKVVVLFFLQDG